MIIFRRVSAGSYRAETQDGFVLALIHDTGRARTIRYDDGSQIRLGRWQATTTSGAGVSRGGDTLAELKMHIRRHCGETQ